MSNLTTEEQHITCTDDMKNMRITCNEEVDVVDVCANCGKEGSDLNICNKCQMVKYCNAACKKKHRTKHKKKCERRVAELHDIKIFKQPPPKEDCPICFLPLPSLLSGSKYKSCCGKIICSGCIYAVRLRDNGVGLCPFCRTPTPDSEEEITERYKKRVDAGDANAMFCLGGDYSEGLFGLTRDRTKAMELLQRAGELGCAKAYCNIGCAYDNGRGVERDEKKAIHYYELAAMGGDGMARHNLGCSEYEKSNWDRATKHWLIAAGGGYDNSVKGIQQLYLDGHATKEDYAKALRAYQKNLGEIRGEQRDHAASFIEEYKYY